RIGDVAAFLESIPQFPADCRQSSFCAAGRELRRREPFDVSILECGNQVPVSHCGGVALGFLPSVFVCYLELGVFRRYLAFAPARELPSLDRSMVCARAGCGAVGNGECEPDASAPGESAASESAAILERANRGNDQ